MSDTEVYPQQQPAAEDPVLAQMKRDDDATIQRNLSAAKLVNPDEHAEALQVARQHGIAYGAAQAALRGGLKAKQDANRDQVQGDPALRAWLLDPHNAALASDAMDEARRFSRSMAATKPQLNSNWLSDFRTGDALSLLGLQRGFLHLRNQFGWIGRQEFEQELEVYDLAAQELRSQYQPETKASLAEVDEMGFWRTLASPITNPRAFVASTGESAMPSALSVMVGGALGAGFSQVAVRGAAARMGVAPIASKLTEAVFRGAGAAGVGAITGYGQYVEEAMSKEGVDMNDPAARKAALRDPALMARAQAAAWRYGTVMGGIDGLSLVIAGRRVSGAKGLMRKAVAGGKELLEQIGFAAASEGGARIAAGGPEVVTTTDYWKNVAMEMGMEVGFGTPEIMWGAARHAIEARSESASKMIQTSTQAANAILQAEALNEAKEKYLEAKLSKRSPERTWQLGAEAAGDSGVRKVRVARETWDEAHKVQGKSPAEAAAAVFFGGDEAYHASAESGEIVFPVGPLMDQVGPTPMWDTLLPDMILDDGGMSARSGEEVFAAREEGFEQAKKEMTLFQTELEGLDDEDAKLAGEIKASEEPAAKPVDVGAERLRVAKALEKLRQRLETKKAGGEETASEENLQHSIAGLEQLQARTDEQIIEASKPFRLPEADLQRGRDIVAGREKERRARVREEAVAAGAREPTMAERAQLLRDNIAEVKQLISKDERLRAAGEAEIAQAEKDIASLEKGEEPAAEPAPEAAAAESGDIEAKKARRKEIAARKSQIAGEQQARRESSAALAAVIEERLVAAGRKRFESKIHASLWARALSVIAQRTGIPLDELAKRFQLQVRAGTREEAEAVFKKTASEKAAPPGDATLGQSDYADRGWWFTARGELIDLDEVAGQGERKSHVDFVSESPGVLGLSAANANLDSALEIGNVRVEQYADVIGIETAGSALSVAKLRAAQRAFQALPEDVQRSAKVVRLSQLPVTVDLNSFLTAKTPGELRGELFGQPEGDFEVGPGGPGRTKGSLDVSKLGSGKLYTLSFYETANRSTFVHEAGHAFLDIMATLAADEATPQALKDDYAGIRKYLGAEEGKPLTPEQHEKWARSFEAYLLEGKAPTPELRRMFAMFKDWLVRLYKDVRGLRVELTPEVRDIMDRLVATDEEIAQAQYEAGTDLNLTDEILAQMTPEQRAEYHAAVAAANEAEWMDLGKDMLAAVTKERLAAFSARVKDVAHGIKKQIDKSASGKALAAIRSGKSPKINREAATKVYSKSMLARLEKAGLLAKDGAAPDAMASMLGQRVDEMAAGLIAADNSEAVARQLAAQQVAAESPDLATSPMRKAAAKKAAASEERAKALKLEAAALAAAEHIGKQERKAREKVEKAKADLQAAVEAGATEARKRRELQGAKQEAFVEGREVGREEASADVGKLKQALEDAERELAATRAAAGMSAEQRRATRDGGESIDEIRRNVKKSLDQTPVELIDPDASLGNARREAQKALKHALNEDYAAALQAKNAERYNFERARIGRAMQEQARKHTKYAADMNSDARQKRLVQAGPTFKDRMNDILHHFGLREEGSGSTDPQGDLKRWIDERAGEEDGREPTFTDALLAGQPRKWGSLTLDEMAKVRSAVQQIWEMAKDSEKLLLDQEGATMSETAAEMGASAAATGRTYKKPKRMGRTKAELEAQRWKWLGMSWIKVPEIMRQADNEKDGGAWWRVFVRPFNKGFDFKRKLSFKINKILAEAKKAAYTKEQLEAFDEEFDVEGVADKVKHSDVVMILLNVRNEGNYSRLVGAINEKTGERVGGNFTEEEIRLILAHASKEDIAYTDKVIDAFEELWPMVAAMEERVTGEAPERVEVRDFTFTLADGSEVTVKGGYFPIVYGDLRGTEMTAKEKGDELGRAATGRAMTKHGHVEARLQMVDRPLRLETAVIEQSLSHVVHDLAFREALIDANRMLNHKNEKGVRDVQDALIGYFGLESYGQLKSLLSDIATNDTRFYEQADWFSARMRRGISAATLGGKMLTALINQTGFTQSIQRIGGKDGLRNGRRYFLRASQELLSSAAKREEITNFIMANSGLMPDRMSNLTREIAEQARLETDGKRAKIEAFNWWMYGRTQVMIDMATWYGAYLKASEAHPDDLALATDIADSVVRESQGTGDLIDLAGIQRGTEWKKWGTLFYHYASTTLARFNASWNELRIKDPETYARFLADTAILLILPSAIGWGLRSTWKKIRGDDDEEQIFSVGGLAAETAANALNLIPYARDAAAMFFGLRPTSANLRPVEAGAGLAKELWQTLPGTDGEFEAMKAVTDAHMLFGIWHTYGADAINQSIEGLAAWIDGQSGAGPQSLIMGPPRN